MQNLLIQHWDLTRQLSGFRFREDHNKTDGYVLEKRSEMHKCLLQIKWYFSARMVNGRCYEHRSEIRLFFMERSWYAWYEKAGNAAERKHAHLIHTTSNLMWCIARRTTVALSAIMKIIAKVRWIDKFSSILSYIVTNVELRDEPANQNIRRDYSIVDNTYVFVLKVRHTTRRRDT